MIGWFVEQKKIGLPDHQLAERDTAAFTAGQVSNIGIARRQVHDRHGHFHLTIKFPKIIRIDSVLKRRHFITKLLHLSIVGNFTEQHTDLVVTIENGLSFSDRELHILEHRLGFIQRRFLLQIPDGETIAQSRYTIKLGVLTRHDPEQSGFTSAIGSQNPNFGTGIESQANIIEDNLLAMFLGEIFNLVNVLAGHGSTINSK